MQLLGVSSGNHLLKVILTTPTMFLVDIVIVTIIMTVVIVIVTGIIMIVTDMVIMVVIDMIDTIMKVTTVKLLFVDYGTQRLVEFS